VDIEAIVRSGLSQVYNPPRLPGEAAAHNWSFARAYADLTLTADVNATTLPDDFGGFDGPVYVTGDSASRAWPVKVYSDGVVEQAIARSPNSSGPPTMAAERQLNVTTAIASNRSQVIVWPKPDQAYVLRVCYYYHANALTTLNPYPPGGSAHRELFIASCLADAERKKDNTKGVMWDYFMERLAASVHADRKRKGQRLGYNGDSSDAPGDPLGLRDYNRRFGWGNPVLINGAVPD
jgi:hypothetical protein